MSSPVQGKRRIDTDLIKLIESKHEVIKKIIHAKGHRSNNCNHFFLTILNLGHNTRWPQRILCQILWT